jgi:hypothetical protein
MVVSMVQMGVVLVLASSQRSARSRTDSHGEDDGRWL